MRKILNLIPAMIGEWDKDLINIGANKAYTSFFGKSSEEIKGMHMRDLLGEEVFNKNLPFIENVLRGNAQTFERDLVK